MNCFKGVVKIELTKEQRNDIRQKLIDNIELYCEKCLKIRHRDKKVIVPFIINKHQRNFIKIVEDWKKKYPIESERPTLFIIILKPRQTGFSTITEAVFFHELQFSKNKVAMIVSYDEKSAVTINEMSNRFYQYLPKIVKVSRRPSRSKGILFENPTNNMEEFEKKPGLQSKFLIDTANNINAGSSFTIDYLHISEIAKWEGKPEETLTSLLQAVPDYGSIVVVESTAKGINIFHKSWKDAENKKNGYVPIFVAWFEHDEYKIDFENDIEKRKFINSLDEEEKQIKETYKVSYEQLNWRRYAITKKCQNNKDIFKQEYPAYPDEAFLTSGRPVYDRLVVQARINELESKYCTYPDGLQAPKDSRGYIEYDEKKKLYKFVPDDYGTVLIYEHPKKGYPYVIGGDIAEGLARGDWLVSQVCDNTNGMQVAKQRLHIHPDLFALEQIKLARYYNQALIANEINNHGHVTITALQRERYYFQYKREVYDRISRTTEQKFGFDTKDQSRQRIIDRSRAIVRDEIHLINDIETLKEMLTFIYNDQGKEEHEADCHDDCVLSFAIMHEGRSQQKATPPRIEDTFGKGLDYVHPSVKIDSAKNPQVKRYYEKLYKNGRKT
uniref:Putative terminase n=1 Tax=viral metagenome TaxID=1070528 RepID=A0A6M3XIC3_9ZZZZ